MVGRRNWETQRMKRVQRGEGGQVCVGVLLRGSGRQVECDTHTV